MRLSTINAGDITTDTNILDYNSINETINTIMYQVSALNESLKIPENIGKVYYLTEDVKTEDNVIEYNSGIYTLILNENAEYQFIKQTDYNGTDIIYSFKTLMYFLENYNTSKSFLPDPGSAIENNYIIYDKTYLSREAVETHINDLETIKTPWTILGYNKTIPQYVKYRKKTNNDYDYKYVSSVDDTSVTATIDGIDQEIFIKHGWENANKIDVNDCTGLLRPITAGCKVYERSEGGFGKTSIFTETEIKIQSVSNNIVENIKARDGKMHTYGNNNPYDCPVSITIDGDEYFFCGYTVTIQSTQLITSFIGTNNERLIDIVFDYAESQFAEAFNRYEDGKSYYIRDGLEFSNIESPVVNDMISVDNVYEYDEATNTMLCKSAYIQAYHTYTDSSITDENAGQLITDSKLSVENNGQYNNGCNKWSQSIARSFLNSNLGSEEIKPLLASSQKNPFENNSHILDNDNIKQLFDGNSIILKFAKDPDFLKYMCPSVNRTSVFDKQYNTSDDGLWKGSFVAYKNLEDCSCANLNKVYRTHDVDHLFLLSYTEVGFTTQNSDNMYDKLDATSTFTDVYPQGNNNDNKRRKFIYAIDGNINTIGSSWILRSPYGEKPSLLTYIEGQGQYNSFLASSTGKSGKRRTIAPACVLY